MGPAEFLACPAGGPAGVWAGRGHGCVRGECAAQDASVDADGGCKWAEQRRQQRRALELQCVGCQQLGWDRGVFDLIISPIAQTCQQPKLAPLVVCARTNRWDPVGGRLNEGEGLDPNGGHWNFHNGRDCPVSSNSGPLIRGVNVGSHLGRRRRNTRRDCPTHGRSCPAKETPSKYVKCLSWSTVHHAVGELSTAATATATAQARVSRRIWHRMQATVGTVKGNKTPTLHYPDCQKMHATDDTSRPRAASPDALPRIPSGWTSARPPTLLQRSPTRHLYNTSY